MGRRQALIAAALALATPARADELTIAIPDEVTGDGRTSVPVNVTGILTGNAKPLPVAEVPVVTCENAAGLAALGNNALPAVLVPAVTAKQSLECSARLRDSRKTFHVNLRPPPPGLYARPAARAAEREAALTAFVFEGTTVAVPSWLKASASDGTVTVKDAGVVSLAIAGKAPRTIAIALVDGTRVGAAFVPVTGSTVLPVESEAGSNVQVWVAGTWFGPVPTKGKIAEVPIDVPPGVTHGVARSTDKKGYVSDVVVDLKIPSRPRIAVASGTKSIGVSESTTVAIAAVGPDGRPLAATAKVVAAAERGTVSAAESLGGGLWSLAYTAPASNGADRITVKLENDASAGTGEVTLGVRAPAAKIELAMGPAFEPGGDVTGSIRVIDEGGIVLREPDLRVTLGGQSVEVRPGDTLTLVGKAPQKTPPNGTLPLVIQSGAVKVETQVFVGGWPASGSIAVSARDRDVRAEVRIVDRYGNLAPEATFELVAEGATLTGIKREGDVYVASLTALRGFTRATVELRTKGKTLAKDSAMIDAVGMIGIGAYAIGGWLDNLGDLTLTRAALGAAVKYRYETFEVAGLVGLEAMFASDNVMIDVGGMSRTGTRSITAIAIPLAVRARRPLGARFGIAGGLAFVPWRTSVRFGPNDQANEAYGETVLGFRLQASGDMRLGPGRAIVGMSYGRASLSDGPVSGQIDGIAFSFGYEWWFRALLP